MTGEMRVRVCAGAVFWNCAVVLAGGCDGGLGEEAEGGAMAEAGTVLVVTAVHARGPKSQPGQPVDLFRATDLTFAGDSLMIVDSGNDRVVVLDRELNVRGTYGRSGAGPGEFRAPVAVRPAGEDLLIYEMGNHRFTRLGRDGSYRDVISSAWVMLSFAVGSGGELYLPSRNRTHFVLRVAGGESQWWGARVDSLPSADSLLQRLGGNEPRIALTAGDTLHVLDDREGVLYKYEPGGRLVQRRSLPLAALDSMKQRRDRYEQELSRGRPAVALPLTKSLSVTAGGSLLVMASGDATCGWVIDAGTYRARRIVIPAEVAEARVLASTPAAVLAEPILYALTDEGIVAFRLAERSVR